MLYNNMTLDELINEIQYSEDPLLKAIYGKLTEDVFKSEKDKINKKLEDVIEKLESAESSIEDALISTNKALDEL